MIWNLLHWSAIFQLNGSVDLNNPKLPLFPLSQTLSHTLAQDTC